MRLNGPVDDPSSDVPKYVFKIWKRSTVRMFESIQHEALAPLLHLSATLLPASQSL